MMPCRLVNICQLCERFTASIFRVVGKTYYCTAVKVKAASYCKTSGMFCQSACRHVPEELNLLQRCNEHFNLTNCSVYVHVCSCHLHVFAGILCPVCKGIWQLQCLILCQKEMTTRRMRTQHRYVSDNTLY